MTTTRTGQRKGYSRCMRIPDHRMKVEFRNIRLKTITP